MMEADLAQTSLAGTNINQRVIDQLQPGDVLVVDIYGKVEDGSWVGDNLTTAIYVATGNGFIIHGGIRDLEGITGIEAPVYHRGAHPTVYTDMMLTGVNVPVRIDNVTVMPGHIVLGDREGVTFIPPHFVEGLIEYSQGQR
ncbi:MAG: hypothetical protein HY235_30575 [Acidobacteria bacterium]|nr:hypothetical protein [Acidobacteriota bacterium]